MPSASAFVQYIWGTLRSGLVFFPVSLVLGACLIADDSPYEDGRVDVFHYKDGRVIAGIVHSSSGEDLTVKIAPGSYIKIQKADLKRNGHEQLSTLEQDYAANVSQLPDTVEQHLRLAAECKQQGLLDLEEAHYRRVLDLDPRNSVALVGLGYTQDDNRWVKKEKILEEERGKVFYRGRWRFPESVKLEQMEEAAKEKLAPLKKNLSRWHNTASFGRSMPQKLKNDAVAKLQQIQDPLAVPILKEFLLDDRKPPPVSMRRLYVHVISRFQTLEAAKALATASVTDPDASVRNACLDGLRGFGREVAVPTYVGYLSNKRNELVNRAAEGLAQFNAPEAILPLIKALITEHVMVTGGGNSMNVGNNGTFGIGGGPKTETVPVQNSSVLGTLSQITGQSFGYDQQRWLNWYANTYAAPAVDLRRD